jgi:ribosome-associated toxin RatA of RatAB toxin-antitoxin module
VAGAELHQRSDRDLLASMSMSRGGVTERFTTRNEFERPTCMTMQLVDGPFRLLAGRWTFTPIGSAGTRVELEMRFEFANPVISMLFGKSFEQSCGQLIDAFIARARQMHAGA